MGNSAKSIGMGRNDLATTLLFVKRGGLQQFLYE